MTDRCSRLGWFCALAALALPFDALAQEVRLGSEFQVNTYTIGYQILPAVATDADGDFVVVWHSGWVYNQDGSKEGVFARRFSSDGGALASEFQVNSYTTDSQRHASVAADADGDFVVAWDSLGQDGSSYGVFARRFSSAGTPLASEFQVNSYTLLYQVGPSVAADADGDFIVAWYSSFQDTSIFAQRYSSAGVPLAGEFQVSSYTSEVQAHLSLAVDADGDFVVVWDSYRQDGSYHGVFAQRFSGAGVPLASEFQINAYTIGFQALPDVAADADGDFVVVWEDFTQDGTVRVVGRRFSSAGIPLTGDLLVNIYTAGGRILPIVDAFANGDFVVVWAPYGRDGSDYGIFARLFSSAGGPLATEFQVNSHTLNEQFRAAVAAADADTFVIAWNSFGQDGWQGGVFAQRFGIATPTATPTATSTVTPTATATPTSTPTPTPTPGALYEIPTLSGIAMAIECLVLLGICLAFLRRRSRLPH